MKRLKLSLTIIAFGLGIGMAFASKVHIKGGTAIYYVDAAGNPTDKVVGSPDCTQASKVCSEQFNLDAEGNPTTPTGQDITMGTRVD